MALDCSPKYITKKFSFLSLKRDAQDLTLFLSRCLIVESIIVYYNSRCYSLSLIVFYICPNFKAPDFLKIFSVDHFEYITCSEYRNSGKSCSPLRVAQQVKYWPDLFICYISDKLKYTIALVWCSTWATNLSLEIPFFYLALFFSFYLFFFLKRNM